MLYKVERTCISKFLGSADLGEFMEERVDLSMVKRVGHLADKIGGAHEGWFALGIELPRVVGHGKPRVIDGAGNTFFVNGIGRAEAVTCVDHPSVHVPRCQAGIG